MLHVTFVKDHDGSSLISRVRNRWAFLIFLQPVQPLRSKSRCIGDSEEAGTRKRPMSETLLCPSTLAMSCWYPVGRILKAVKHTSLLVSCVASSSPLGRVCFLSIACQSGTSPSSRVSLALPSKAPERPPQHSAPCFRALGVDLARVREDRLADRR